MTVDVLQRYREQLQGEAVLLPRTLLLALGDCRLRVASNSDALLDRLERYFHHVVTAGDHADIEVVAVERAAPELALPFVDWRREASKRGRKDAYLDVPGGRLVQKVRTGMVFLQCQGARLAAGPCLANDNQVINFINAQHMNWLQQRGWLICHAAGIERGGRSLALAGFSGGGKSTLMLKLMERPGTHYLSNDRLFVRARAGEVAAAGIAKLPRVNPGTIVYNPRLHPLIDADRRAALAALPGDQLWDLEEKYDVMIDDLYGQQRIVQQAPLQALVILNWQRQGRAPLSVQAVDLNERRDLLGAVMKSPGPFYQHQDGRFHQDTTKPVEEDYLHVLADVTVYEATGRVDFAALADLCDREVLPL